MIFDGLFAESQSFGDILIGKALGYTFQHIHFPGRQPFTTAFVEHLPGLDFHIIGYGGTAKKALRQFRIDESIAAVHYMDSLDEHCRFHIFQEIPQRPV